MSGLQISLNWSDWWSLIQNFMVFSIVSVGGPLVLLPEMRNFLVSSQGWVSDEQFSASVVIAQASPGPNVLFVALLGWNVGLNAGGYWLALFGATIIMVAMMIPSCALIYGTSRWVQKNRDWRAVRAFKQGMSPVVVSLLVSSGVSLATAGTTASADWPLWLVSAVVTGLVLWGKIPMFWLLAIGGVLGASGILTVV